MESLKWFAMGALVGARGLIADSLRYDQSVENRTVARRC